MHADSALFILTLIIVSSNMALSYTAVTSTSASIVDDSDSPSSVSAIAGSGDGVTPSEQEEFELERVVDSTVMLNNKVRRGLRLPLYTLR